MLRRLTLRGRACCSLAARRFQRSIGSPLSCGPVTAQHPVPSLLRQPLAVVSSATCRLQLEEIQSNRGTEDGSVVADKPLAQVGGRGEVLGALCSFVHAFKRQSSSSRAVHAAAAASQTIPRNVFLWPTKGARRVVPSAGDA